MALPPLHTRDRIVPQPRDVRVIGDAAATPAHTRHCLLQNARLAFCCGCDVSYLPFADTTCHRTCPLTYYALHRAAQHTTTRRTCSADALPPAHAFAALRLRTLRLARQVAHTHGTCLHHTPHVVETLEHG